MEGNLRKVLIYLTILLTLGIIIILGLMLKDVFFASSKPRNPAEQAYDVAKALVAKNPKNPDYLFRLAKAEADLNRTQDAIGHLKKAIDLQPAAPMLHYTLAQIYKDLNQESNAIKELKEELRVTELRNELAWYDLGVIMNKRKDYNQAVACLTRALQRMDSSADAHYELGKAYEGLGKYDLALKEYDEALRFIPDHAEAQRAIEELEAKNLNKNSTKNNK
ncbi:MAG: tetratricopeptide repeat protein [Firmicutes bacterium]|nr:tetratricopeptide repeat protein [Bacillota bacterium]